MTDIELLLLHSNTWNHLTVDKEMNADYFQYDLQTICLWIIYIWYMYKRDLLLNILWQW